MYISTLSLTSALDGVGGQRHVPAALPPGKTRHQLYRRAGLDGCEISRPHRDSNPGPVAIPTALSLHTYVYIYKLFNI